LRLSFGKLLFSLYRLCWRGQAFLKLNRREINSPAFFIHAIVTRLSLCVRYATEIENITESDSFLVRSLFSAAIKRYKDDYRESFVTIMTSKTKYTKRNMALAASLLSAVSLAFSPVMFPAFANNLAKGKISASQLLESFTPAGVDSKLAAKFGQSKQTNSAVKISKNHFAFTPAGIKVKGNRTMTIAARTDSPLSSQAVATRSALRLPDLGSSAPVTLAKSDFHLTAAKGWKGFSAPKLAETKLAVRAPVANLNIASGDFRLDGKAPNKKSRFDADVRVDQNRSAAPAPSSSNAAGDYKVDLEGRFSISKRVAVTAGVRYESERERIAPSVEDRNDSEAVYVGTKIRF
jgi:hypothetical protein